jgi:hypothetical protein
MTHERRGGPRKAVDEPIEVTDCIRDKAIGRLANLSRHGVMLIAHRAVHEGALYQVRFCIPGSDTEIELGVHAMWTHSAVTHGYQWSGLRIISISETAADALKRWLDEAPA